MEEEIKQKSQQMEEKNTCKVCVTGGAGYIGSSLVKMLLDIGYIVHATLRNLGMLLISFIPELRCSNFSKCV